MTDVCIRVYVVYVVYTDNPYTLGIAYTGYYVSGISGYTDPLYRPRI
jgi:hypothetical protein